MCPERIQTAASGDNRVQVDGPELFLARGSEARPGTLPGYVPDVSRNQRRQRLLSHSRMAIFTVVEPISIPSRIICTHCK